MFTRQILGSNRLLIRATLFIIIVTFTACTPVQKPERPYPPIQPVSFGQIYERSDEPRRLVVDAIGLDTVVEDLGWSASVDPAGRILNDWDVTAYSAGWHVNSSMPGQGGNVVVSGHNNILGAVFRELDQLDAGDIATIWSGQAKYEYKISEVLIVPERDATPEQRRQNAEWISAFDDDRLTLVTCWPRDGNSHRIIALGHRVDNTAQTASVIAPGG